MSRASIWWTSKGADHAHCPLGCESPQVSEYQKENEFICGVCYFNDGVVTPCLPCVPGICEDV